MGAVGIDRYEGNPIRLLGDRDRLLGPILDEHRVTNRSGTAAGMPDRCQFQRWLVASEPDRHLGAVTVIDSPLLKGPVGPVLHASHVRTFQQR